MNSRYNIVGTTLEESYQVCMEWMSEHSKSFYFASRFLPEDQRKSVAALYAVCRLSDDIVDEAPEGITIDQINFELDQLKKTISKLSNGYTSTNPILHAFGDTLRKHNIPVEYMHELIEGVRMDLTKKEYYSEDELDLYMFRVASTVGLMMTHIFIQNPRKQTLARAADLGRAMQLTNILRDIKEDFGMPVYDFLVQKVSVECLHDFEIAMTGRTSEDVAASLGTGAFGMARETGEFLWCDKSVGRVDEQILRRELRHGYRDPSSLQPYRPATGHRFCVRRFRFANRQDRTGTDAGANGRRRPHRRAGFH